MAKTININLALQGGGAHGAFTWGVLDRLLEDPDIAFHWMSATSAGAVNAVALAAGLAEGSREKAREKLFAIWQAIHKAGVQDFSRLNPFLTGLPGQPPLSQMASLWSPYEFNPLGFDPLRKLLAEFVNIDLIREKSPVELLIAATHVATGMPRFFRNGNLSIEAILASACLPTLHHAVEIDGEAYWDGGFSSNPDIVTLGAESPCPDTLLVLITPRENPGLPKTARDIAFHASRLTFNAPLIRDVSIVQAIRETAPSLLASGRLAPLAKHRYHLIDGGSVTRDLNPESSIKPDWDTLKYLHGAGRNYAGTWLDVARGDVGRRETVNLFEHLFPSLVVEAPLRAAKRSRRRSEKTTSAIKPIV